MNRAESDGPQTLLLIGAGNMGRALLAPWLESELKDWRVAVSDPAPSPWVKGLADSGRITLIPDTAEMAALNPAVLVLAVKPQMMGDVLGGLKPVMAAAPLVISIAAGTTIATIEQALGPSAVLRVVPNTPALAGRGMSVLVANSRVNAEQREFSTRLLEAVGRTAWVEDENLMDAVTAVSGSGPAYVFHLAECMARAGAEAGLDPDLAAELARVTVAGAGELLWQSDESAETLRVQVTSPGGTTKAALEVLMDGDAMQDLMTRAVAAAKKRGRELGKG